MSHVTILLHQGLLTLLASTWLSHCHTVTWSSSHNSLKSEDRFLVIVISKISRWQSHYKGVELPSHRYTIHNCEVSLLHDVLKYSYYRPIEFQFTWLWTNLNCVKKSKIWNIYSISSHGYKRSVLIVVNPNIPSCILRSYNYYVSWRCLGIEPLCLIPNLYRGRLEQIC